MTLGELIEQDQLYKFGVNAIGGTSHTLQLFLGRDDALALLVSLANQLKTVAPDEGNDISVILVGKMVVCDY